MTTCKAPRKTLRPQPTEPLPAKPDRRLWETDSAKAFAAGGRWLLAVSRTA